MTTPGPACAGSRVDFHDVAQTVAAMRVCNGDEAHAPCPIRAACLAAAEAREEPCGIWGGESFNPADTTEMVIEEPPAVVAEGFVRPSVRARHGVRGVPCTAGPGGGRCNDCRRVHASYVRDWRRDRVVTRPEILDLPEQIAIPIGASA